MTDIDRLIDANLSLVFNSRDQSAFWINFNNSLNTNLPKERIAEYMEKEGLIRIEPSKKERCDLTRYGYDIAKNNSWLKEVENRKRHAKKEEEKFNFDYSLSKWQKKTFWWVFIIGILSFIYSLFDLVTTYLK